MRVLVTGANGFVGQWVCRAMADAGIAVRGTVRRTDVPQRLPNGFALNDRVVVGEIVDGMDWGAALHGVDAIVHLAARVHVMRERARDPLEAFRAVNVHATACLARAAAACGVRRFVYVSSVKVHGERTTTHPFTEYDAPHPEDVYAQSKREAEQVLEDIAAMTGLELAIVRPPLVYGPSVRGNFFALLRAINRGIPLPFGSTVNERSMISVRNLADVLLRCVTHPRAVGQQFLVRDAESVGTRELINRIAAVLGSRPRLWPFPRALLAGFAWMVGKHATLRRLTDSLVVDGAHVRAALGWTPPVTMEEELRATAAWYREIL
ncbi:MAG: NAD-dependent epimerase/dehydratase family protein [bacterium]|nr:NAD-dependent epimerase/dehydratase family protein [bacterium]